MATKTAGRQRQQQTSQKDVANGVVVSFDSDDTEEEEGRSSSASSDKLSSADEPSSEDELPAKPVKQSAAVSGNAKQNPKGRMIQSESEEDSSEEEEEEDKSARRPTTVGKQVQANGRGGPDLAYSLTLRPSVARNDDKDDADSDSDVDEEIVNVFAKKQAVQKEQEVDALPKQANNIRQKTPVNSPDSKDTLPDVALTEQQPNSSKSKHRLAFEEKVTINGEKTKKLSPSAEVAVDKLTSKGKPEEDNRGEHEVHNGHQLQSDEPKPKSNAPAADETKKSMLGNLVANLDSPDQKLETETVKKVTSKEDSSDQRPEKKATADVTAKQDDGSEEKLVEKRTKKTKREKPPAKSDDVRTELTDKPDLLQNDASTSVASEKSLDVSAVKTVQDEVASKGNGNDQPDVTGIPKSHSIGNVSDTAKSAEASVAETPSSGTDEKPQAADVAISVEAYEASEVAESAGTAEADFGDNKNGPRSDIKSHLTIDRPSVETDEQNESTAGLVNEDSDYTFRRRSIDDFIRKILEEARLEQKKRMEDIQVEPEKPTTLPASSLSPETETAADVQKLIEPEVDLQPVDDVQTTADVAPPVEVNAKQPDVMSMLDRRLASTDRKREETERQVKNDRDLPVVVETKLASKSPEDKSLRTESKFSTIEQLKHQDNESISVPRRSTAAGVVAAAAKADEDIDQELADIGRYFAKRTPLNVDDAAVADQEEDLETGWLKVRPKPKPFHYDNIEDDVDAAEDIGLDQPTATGRRFSIEEFAPQRRAETDEVIRNKMRPVRALIDQQTDIIQRLKVVGREISGLDEEIRQLRQRCIVDRQSHFDTVGTAVADELRLYENEQRAADERIGKQVQFPRFVREQFVATNMPSADSRLLRGRPPIPPLSSVASGSAGSYYASASTGSDFRRAQSVVPGGDGDAYPWNRKDVRSGSVARETSMPRFSVEESTTTTVRRSAASANLTSNYSSRRLSTGPDDDEIEDVIRRSRQARANSVQPGAYYSRSSADSAENKSFTSSRPSAAYASSDDYSERRRGSTPLASSSSEDHTSTPRYSRRYSVAVEDSSGGSARLARRGSIGDYGSASSGGRATKGSEFQSKFLDKVRERRAMGLDGSSSSASATDKPFQSRFLRSSSSVEPSSERRFSTAT